jgi:hypothetical protein
MTAPLFSWVVWHDRAPLNSPKEIGSVQAPNKTAAEDDAKKRWPKLALLVQSAASAREQPYSKHPLPDAPLASATSRANYRHPKKHNPSKQRQLEFNDQKRAAHVQRRARGDAMDHHPRTDQ